MGAILFSSSNAPSWMLCRPFEAGAHYLANECTSSPPPHLRTPPKAHLRTGRTAVHVLGNSSALESEAHSSIRASHSKQPLPTPPHPRPTPTSHVRTPSLTQPEGEGGGSGGCRKFSAFLTGRDNHPRDPPAWSKAKRSAAHSSRLLQRGAFRD